VTMTYEVSIPEKGREGEIEKKRGIISSIYL
jgi:hypothetical protein